MQFELEGKRILFGFNYLVNNFFVYKSQTNKYYFFVCYLFVNKTSRPNAPLISLSFRIFIYIYKQQKLIYEQENTRTCL